MDYLSDLNDSQRAAVEHIDGPLLILAGAGSGKTRALTYRMAHIIRTRNTRDILAVTFTNKAAREMLSRVENLMGADSRGLWVLTFHSMGNRILRREMEKLDRPAEFVIFDDADRKGLIKQCLKELNMDATAFTPRNIGSVIDRMKNSLISPEQFAGEASGPQEKGAARVYKLYERRLREIGAVDFSDLLSLPLELFKKNPDVLEDYRRLFRYILVDEYQDTNHAQYTLLKLLVGPERNICVVGDEDQSIYRWRGADIRNILNFQKDFPQARLIKLEQNYRSTPVVLHAAEAVIARNRQRIGKRLIPVREGGEPLIYYPAIDERDEARFVAEQVADLIRGGEDEMELPPELRGSNRADEIAVFYRTHAQSRAIEDAFRARDIPYIVVGGVRFYDRKEIKDILACMRLIVNPRDDVSFLRIVNVPPRKIGAATLGKLREYASRNALSLLEASGYTVGARRSLPTQDPTSVGARRALPLQGTKVKALKTFADMIESLAEEGENLSAPELIDLVMDNTGYREWVKREKTAEALGRLENLDELVRAAEEYDESAEEPSLVDFLDRVSLLTNLDKDQPEGGAVTLMTLHTAKGLEFKAVFMVGMEDGLFPHIMSQGDPNAEEEERRLCYVGMTRAEDLLYITRAQERRLRGQTRYNLPSPYIADIPEELVESPHFSKPREKEWKIPEEYDDHEEEPESDIVYDMEEIGLRPGAKVRHPSFGLGLVESLQGSGERMKVRVYFHKGGHKTLMVKYAGLEPA